MALNCRIYALNAIGKQYFLCMSNTLPISQFLSSSIFANDDFYPEGL